MSSLQSHSTRTQHGGWREVVSIVVYALVLAFLVRVFFFQPFNIPSGSMKGTLLVGDYLFVSKFSYGYSKYTFPRIVTLCVPFTENCVTFRVLPDLFAGRVMAERPKRGDVAVFKLPRDNSTDYIKRVIGLPGDVILMKDGVLHINGVAVPKRRVEDFIEYDEAGNARRTARYEETLPEGVKYFVLDQYPNNSSDNAGPFKVPADHYFMMGDNRDNSTDSRDQSRGGVGFVPFENFVGRALVIFFSAATEEAWQFRLTRPWRWPADIRWERFFTRIK
ncbi:MAG TPA: signal peptidase I [Hyphomicrobiaceae bacterium]|nr:signal peptidase I [Hyphomicrobiaceae bacterium]